MNLAKPNLLALAIASCLSSPLQAKATDLEPMVVTASRVEQSPTDYTGNLLVITNEQLSEKAIQTLPEALDRIGGIASYSNGGLGTTSSLLVRGHDNKRLLLLVDGMRFNDPTSLGGAQWQHLLVSDIERIEILEGAQAGIWGADAGAGVIHVITKQATPGTQSNISYALGTLGQKQTHASVSHANKDLDIRIGYTGLSSDEFSSITPIIQGSKQDPLNYEKDGYRNDTLNAKLGWHLAQNQRLELNAFKADAKGNYDSFSANTTPYYTYRQQTVGLSYAFVLSDWQLKLSAHVGDIKNDFNGSTYRAEVNQQTLTATRNDPLGAWTLGADNLQQSTNRLSNAIIDQSNRQTGVYVARTQKFYLPHAQQPTILNISLRHDDFSDYQSYLGKRLGIKQLLGKDSYLAINLADTCRMPNLFERFVQYDSNWNVTARKDVGNLHPETIDSKEISLGWKGISVTRFEDKVTNLIDFDLVNGHYYNRAGETQLNGWQWQLNQSFPHISSQVVLTYQRLDAKGHDGIAIPRRPHTSGSIDWTYLGLANTVLGLQAQFVGNRFDSYDTTTGKAGPNTGNFWLWHANASYQWNKNIRVFVKGVNLTDQRLAQATDSYNASQPTSYYAYSPRTFLLGLEYKL